MKKAALWLCLCTLSIGILFGCDPKTQENKTLSENAEPITLVLTGGWVECPGIELLAQKFNEKYPNCTVVYEYLQNYEESLSKRLQGETDKIDVFMASNIQANSPYLPYALELFSQNDVLNLSNIHDGLIKNFTFINSDKAAAPQIYAVPIGAELRGMFVNKTLLRSLDINVPTNCKELYAACQKLTEKGYIPIQANPTNAGQHLVYPYICNIIANASDYTAVYNRVNSCEKGVSELFNEPLQFLYTLMEKNYYNYKRAETELSAFKSSSNENIALDFLNIKKDESGSLAKADDIGNVAFMPNVMSLSETIARVKEDYHSAIDYEFILSPVSDEGGFAYMSPASGIAINKNSDNVEWAVKFLNFFFEEENNKAFAEAASLIPGTPDAMSYITKKFDIPASRVSQLGQVSFDYQFYTLINKVLINIIKGNNPKYMDNSVPGSPALYPFEYYTKQLEASFEEQQKQLN